MKNIVKAVFVLTLFSLADRILGFLFKIFLSRELGAISLGIYQVALSVFYVLLTLTTSGIPLIISKLTAKYKIKNELKAQHSLVSAALIVGIVLSVAVSAIFLIFSELIGNIFPTKQSMTVLLILLPGVICSGIYAAFRGNLWGNQRYKTVSIIEVLEQLFRIAVCVMLFYMGMDKLKMTAVAMSASCAFTAVACVLCYFSQKGKLANPKGQLVPLIKQSTPITLIRASNSLINFLIALAVPFLLKKQGMSVADSMYVFGSSVGMAFPLLYIPITVVGSLAYVLIPTLSTAISTGNKKSVQSQTANAISFSIVVASLFVPLFYALGEPLGVFVYNNALSGEFLRKSAWLLIPMAVESITSSMMNSLDLEKSSFINYGIGSAILFGIMFAFYKGFRIEIMIYGMGASWTVSSILDIFRISKKTGVKLTFIPTLIKSVLLILPTAFLTKTIYSLVSSLPIVLSIGISGFTGLIFMSLLGLIFGIFDFGIVFSKKKNAKSKPQILSFVTKKPKKSAKV